MTGSSARWTSSGSGWSRPRRPRSCTLSRRRPCRPDPDDQYGTGGGSHVRITKGRQADREADSSASRPPRLNHDDRHSAGRQNGRRNGRAACPASGQRRPADPSRAGSGNLVRPDRGPDALGAASAARAGGGLAPGGRRTTRPARSARARPGPSASDPASGDVERGLGHDGIDPSLGQCVLQRDVGEEGHPAVSWTVACDLTCSGIAGLAWTPWRKDAVSAVISREW